MERLVAIQACCGRACTRRQPVRAPRKLRRTGLMSITGTRPHSIKLRVKRMNQQRLRAQGQGIGEVVAPLLRRPTAMAGAPHGDDQASMVDSGGGRGVVYVTRARYRNQARCSCGWIGKACLLLSSAKVDALLHAAQADCKPAVPLFQPGAAMSPEAGDPEAR